MKRFWNYFSWLFSLPLLLIAICFAVGNREPTIINLWPSGYVMPVQIYLLGLLPLVVGLVSGAGMQWFVGLRHRMAAQRLGKEVARLKAEIVQLREEMAAKQQQPVPDNPAERARFKMIAGFRNQP